MKKNVLSSKLFFERVRFLEKEWRKFNDDGTYTVRTCGWSPPGDHPVGCGMKLRVKDAIIGFGAAGVYSATIPKLIGAWFAPRKRGRAMSLITPGDVLTGACLGLLMPVFSDYYPPELRGSGAGTISTMGLVGRFFGPMLAGVVADATGVITSAFGFGAIAMIVAAAIAFTLPNLRTKSAIKANA